jgi:hypothetical protein
MWLLACMCWSCTTAGNTSCCLNSRSSSIASECSHSLTPLLCNALLDGRPQCSRLVLA